MFACKPHKCRDETKSEEKLVSPTSYVFLVWISAYILLYVQLMFAHKHSHCLYIRNQKKRRSKNLPIKGQNMMVSKWIHTIQLMNKIIWFLGYHVLNFLRVIIKKKKKLWESNNLIGNITTIFSLYFTFNSFLVHCTGLWLVIIIMKFQNY
jgi:hypothetical protein